MTDFVLHPGLPKSGTSTLQRAVFCNHSQIHYLGKRWDSSAGKGAASPEIYDLLSSVLWKAREFDADRSRRLYQELVVQQANPQQTIVASWEALGDSSPLRFSAMLSRLEQTVGSVRVMFGIRNPLTRLPSLYLQGLEGHFVGGFRKAFKGAPYLDTDQWLDRNNKLREYGNFWQHYIVNIKAATEAFGAESVGILVFEQLRPDPMGFYATVSDFMHIDCDETRRLFEGAHFNTRITRTEFEYAREQNDNYFRRMRWRIQSPKQRRRGLERAIKERGEGGSAVKVELPQEWQATIRQDTAEGHRWMQDTFAIDLESYGYPL